MEIVEFSELEIRALVWQEVFKKNSESRWIREKLENQDYNINLKDAMPELNL
jgi:hypothetical protein